MTQPDGRPRAGSNGSTPGASAAALEAAFGRPPGVSESFAPGQPPPPAPPPPPPPAPPHVRRLFGRPAGAPESFDPPPGARQTATPPPESPWWKPDAPRDPWRDARSQARLGGPPNLDG